MLLREHFFLFLGGVGSIISKRKDFLRSGSWFLNRGGPTTGKKKGFEEFFLLFLKGSGAITCKRKGFLREGSGLLSENGLITNKEAGFLRGGKNR